MTRKLVNIAMAGSAALLLGAFTFQLAGYAPCKMCLWQRWPHAAAVLVGLAFLFQQRTLFMWLGALATLTTAAIGAFHAGVERKWWNGPTSCTGGGSGLSGLSGDDLLSFDQAAPIVMCDDIAWQLAGISMAGWNAILSLVLVAIWVTAARKHTAADRA